MESNVSFVGTRASGKTSCAGLLYLFAQERALREPLRVRTHERNLNLRGIASSLLRGDYPPATPIDENFEATVELEFRGFLRRRRVNLSFIDVAGETLRSVMDRFERHDYNLNGMQELTDLNKYLLNAEGFVLVADLPRAMGLEDPGGLPPDIALARFLNSIWRYKNEVRWAPRLRGVALVLTKYDLVRGVLDMEGLHLNDRKSFRQFLQKYMVQTHVAINGYIGFNKVEMFYSGVQTSQDTGRIILDARQRPMYTATQYQRLLNWLSRRFGR